MKVGVYVDVANIAYNGGFGMRYEVLREFAMRNNAENRAPQCLCHIRFNAGQKR
jgi:hypothetical protein